ncbi:hypothetical protein AVEN_116630-1 [Araneus ventricosus]|uniref:Peptidase S1 domain-containing protein n=1 Tax=Araneus ventricosus TaxID=182803 RepID=A0A4Y2R8F4_ARAVE|nr:hypothetical protein AVEN_77128-1 [Araneus ventricosus]GBO28182.1 hypothetical protein AVEN_116630-1 [Araneus ventricosus]
MIELVLATGRDCNLRGTGNPSYNCTIGMHGSYCDINCNGKREGRYYCYPGRSWNSTLPSCVSDCGRVFQDVHKQTGKYTRSDWPWTVGISTVGEDDVEKMLCAGALLNSKTVLTAAHCATSSRNINLHFGHRLQSATGAPVPEQVRTIQISQVNHTSGI